MAVTIMRANGMEERHEGAVISHNDFALLIFGDGKERKPKPIEVIPLAEFVWARDDAGRFVSGGLKLSGPPISN